MSRKCGILMSISSLPSEYGIGCFSKEAYEFVDQLKEAGQTCWQLLPLGPTSYGDSPYQSFSTFAGNPYFIDPNELIRQGFLTKKKCGGYDFGKQAERTNYEALFHARFKMLYEAYRKSGIGGNPDFLKFEKKNGFWLEDYALYMAVKESFGHKSYYSWEEGIRFRKKEALEKYRVRYADRILFYKFIQYEFYREWKALKKYANSKGIRIIGDIPIYVAMDSADTWAHPELFQFEKDGTPKAVAGCPPDAFSADGQLWGNPLYDWEYHKKTNYQWWIRRLKNCFELYDIVRIDHFRGFDEYYSIPYPSKTARGGKWVKGPGYDLFKAVKEKLGDREVIAEDLGYITPSVVRLVKKTGYPGMKVLQFAFDSREESDYLPHNYLPNSVVYTGTHDNNTTLAWYRELVKRDKKYAAEYLNISDQIPEKEIPWLFIRAAYASVSELVVIPMQDILSLGGQARMNYPSTVGGNWEWRMKKGAFSQARRKKLRKLTEIYRRLPGESKK